MYMNIQSNTNTGLGQSVKRKQVKERTFCLKACNNEILQLLFDSVTECVIDGEEVGEKAILQMYSAWIRMGGDGGGF